MCLEDTVRIPLRAKDGSVRAYALVDAADADFVNQWRWCMDKDGYAIRIQWDGIHSQEFRLHRELLGLTRGDGLEVDHRDRDRLNNRRQNLRVLPKGRNQQNTTSAKGTSSQYRGVHWNKRRQKWRAALTTNGRYMHLGSFTSELQAAEAVKAARLRLMPYAVD